VEGRREGAVDACSGHGLHNGCHVIHDACDAEISIQIYTQNSLLAKAYLDLDQGILPR
jgi:hypothetical protein